MTHILREKAQEIEILLEQSLPPSATPPSIIHEAMRYALLGGRKRLRAIMAVAACESVEAILKRPVGLRRRLK